MKSRYRPAFNEWEFGPAEARAQRYWEKRKGAHLMKDGRRNFTTRSGGSAGTSSSSSPNRDDTSNSNTFESPPLRKIVHNMLS